MGTSFTRLQGLKGCSGMVQLCRQHLLLGLHVVLGVCLHLSLAARASSWEAAHETFVRYGDDAMMAFPAQRTHQRKSPVFRCVLQAQGVVIIEWVFPEAAKAMAEQAAAAPEATAIDPTAAAASTDTAAGAAVVPPTPGTEPKSPHSLPSVIFRPGRLIEKTLMIEAADGSSVPAPPAIPPRHPLPQPPPAPLNQGSPNLGQTRAEREFVLPKPMPVGASFSEAQFEDYESVVEAARAAIESASQQL
ncbi:hypothetical protein AK812_SmicGene30319 [Symbiodinium microadriaticum]|uniref:Uncharacterized protein n=1 Tax=Symbiodinium microadriaticum TaxID=2951 RepID=A0A1Q9CZN1_SYMMI|nr:hypothetical protein AK812_SmicGene30319 [Symbiodinium microadriaticum]